MKQSEQAAREATAMVYGTPGYATMSEKEQNKVNEAVLRKIAAKYDVYPEMVEEAVRTMQAEDEAAEKQAAAFEEEVKNSKWLTFYYKKWRPLPFVVRFALVFGAAALFPPLMILIVPFLAMKWVHFEQNNPDHWTTGLTETAAKGVIAATVYSEYKKFRDGPKK